MQNQKLERPENKRVSICIYTDLQPLAQTRTRFDNLRHRPQVLLFLLTYIRRAVRNGHPWGKLNAVNCHIAEKWGQDKEEAALLIRWSLENYNGFEVDLCWVWVSRMLRGPPLLPESSFFKDMWSGGGDCRTPPMDDPNRPGMYQCLLIVNSTFIIFNPDAWSWVASSMAHYGSIIIVIISIIGQRKEFSGVPCLGPLVLSCLVHWNLLGNNFYQTSLDLLFSLSTGPMPFRTCSDTA